MITKQLIERIFSAANILRWNDHIRPFDFFEIDKQAHKMIIAYIIAKFDEEDNKKIDWINLIEGAIFEFFHRTMLTDLKPEVYHEIMSKKKKELNKWVLRNLNDDIIKLGKDFTDRFEQYLFDEEYAKYEKRILAASHEFSTRWEFGIIYPWNKMLYGINTTKETVEDCVSEFCRCAKSYNEQKILWLFGFMRSTEISTKMGTIFQTTENHGFRTYVYSSNFCIFIFFRYESL